MPLPTLAVCERCGRGFVTMPKPEARDPFFPANKRPPRPATDEVCGGLIVLTQAGIDFQKSTVSS